MFKEFSHSRICFLSLLENFLLIQEGHAKNLISRLELSLNMNISLTPISFILPNLRILYPFVLHLIDFKNKNK